MKPWFRIIAGGADATNSFGSRGVSITYTDNSGHENDSVEFEVDDREPYLQVPAKGTTIGLSIGYAFQSGAESRYNGLQQYVGLFEVDETRFSHPPRKLAIRAHANNTGNTFKAHKDRDWDDKTIRDIVNQIAGEHGMTPVVVGAIGDKKLEHIDQPNQSDMDFLTRLAKHHGGLLKVAEGKIVLAEEGQELSIISGLGLGAQIVNEHECSSYEGVIQSRSDYDGAAMRWHDWDKAKETLETEGDPAKALRTPYQMRTQDEAKDGAKSKKDKLDKETEQFSFTCVGNPMLVAETLVTLVGFRPGLRTAWRIKTATHKLSNSGYTTDCTCELPNAGDKNASTTGRA